MGEQERISRRQLLAAGVGVTGSNLFARLASAGNEGTPSDIDGWIINLDAEEIEDETGTIEEIREPSMTPCTGGELYVGQLCTGAEFRLLVGWGTPQPTVGESYHFFTTGNADLRGDVKVQLEVADSCLEAPLEIDDHSISNPRAETSTTTKTPTTTKTTTDTPTTTTETETTTTTTTETTPITIRTDEEAGSATTYAVSRLRNRLFGRSHPN